MRREKFDIEPFDDYNEDYERSRTPKKKRIPKDGDDNWFIPYRGKRSQRSHSDNKSREHRKVRRFYKQNTRENEEE